MTVGFWEATAIFPDTLFFTSGWLWMGLPAGALMMLGLLRAPRISGLMLMLVSALTWVVVITPASEITYLFVWQLGLYLAQYLIGMVVVVFIARGLVGFTQRIRSRWIRRSALARDERTDIRTVQRVLPKMQEPYDPLEFCGHSDKLFVGLSAAGDPVYVAQDLWRKSHVDIVGMTGSGKGVLAGVLLSQAVNQGEVVIVVDPKHDEYAPKVLKQAAQEAEVPWHCIDLGSDTAQWNPLLGKTTDEIEELFIASFGLGERGADSDFYRASDRTGARVCARMYDGESLPSLLVAFRGESEARKAVKFVADMEEIAGAACVRTETGLDLGQAIEEGGIIYVRGATRYTRTLKLQKMFVLSVIQHCERRRREGARPVCLFLDEFRYLVSEPVLEALASIRDKRAHLILAHQTINDLRNVPSDIDPAQVVSSVTENCGLKFTYRVNDPDTALWLARMSGNILIDDETRSLETDMILTEKEREIRSLRQTERYLIDTNMLQSLPMRCAVSYGNGLADFIFTAPISVKHKSG